MSKSPTASAAYLVAVAAMLLAGVASAAEAQCSERHYRSVQSLTPVQGRRCDDTGNDYDDFSACCLTHAACYATCNAPRATCDRDYGKCLGSVCKLSSKKDRCDASKKTLLKRKDAAAFDAAQQGHCECVHANTVGTRYMQVADTFFRRADLKRLEQKTAAFDDALLQALGQGEWRLLYDAFRSHAKGLPLPSDGGKKKAKRNRHVDDDDDDL